MAVGSLTAARKKIHPRNVDGPLRRWRWAISVVLQAVLFLGPWIRWHGRQAVLIDLPGRRLHLFDVVLWPQETYFLLILVVFAALLLFASTAVAGRMWCGYACPQTLLTDCFVTVERWIEGDRARRLLLERAPWTPRKILKMAFKWSIWTAMSLWLGITFVAYFEGGQQVLTEPPGPGTITMVLAVAGFAWFAFGWFREQACHYVCPYARFQSALIDKDSLIVAYDARRGEPRGKPSMKGAGDCVDCQMCVQVCPMGIDIRDGLQLECIACTACIDACDTVMDRLQRPRGLIRYTSLQGLEGMKTRVLRPRVVVYCTLLVGLAALFAFLMVGRRTLDLDVVREAQAGPFIQTPDGRIANVYTLKLFNKSQRSHQVRITIEGVDTAELMASPNPVSIPPDQMLEERVMVLRKEGPPVQPVTFRLTSDDDRTITETTSFVGPVR